MFGSGEGIINIINGMVLILESKGMADTDMRWHLIRIRTCMLQLRLQAHHNCCRIITKSSLCNNRPSYVAIKTVIRSSIALVAVALAICTLGDFVALTEFLCRRLVLKLYQYLLDSLGLLGDSVVLTEASLVGLLVLNSKQQEMLRSFCLIVDSPDGFGLLKFVAQGITFLQCYVNFLGM